jgi:hypothetical protein
MQGAHLMDPGPRGVSLALDNAVASTLDFSDGFTADGTVQMRAARVSGTLTLEGAVLNGRPDGRGLSLAASLMQAVDFDFTLARSPSGAVDLQGAQVSYLHDSEHSWPDVVELDGFVYGSIKRDEAGERRAALSPDPPADFGDRCFGVVRAVSGLSRGFGHGVAAGLPSSSTCPQVSGPFGQVGRGASGGW